MARKITQAASGGNKAKRKPGRPTTYTAAAGSVICDRIAGGESLRSICRDAKMPHMKSVLRWVFNDALKDFRAKYELAREIQAEVIFEETVEIADDASEDIQKISFKTKKGTLKIMSQPNRVAVDRARLRVDTRKWFLARMAPKKYAEKIDITSGGKKITEPRRAVISYVVPKEPK